MTNVRIFFALLFVELCVVQGVASVVRSREQLTPLGQRGVDGVPIIETHSRSVAYENPDAVDTKSFEVCCCGVAGTRTNTEELGCDWLKILCSQSQASMESEEFVLHLSFCTTAFSLFRISIFALFYSL